MAKTARARQLRVDATDAERLLWRRLRDRQLGGHKFRRQHPVSPYIADFACTARNLIVELDGGQHNETVDGARDAYLTRAGYRILRFWNHDVQQDTEAVLLRVLENLTGTET